MTISLNTFQKHRIDDPTLNMTSLSQEQRLMFLINQLSHRLIQLDIITRPAAEKSITRLTSVSADILEICAWIANFYKESLENVWSIKDLASPEGKTANDLFGSGASFIAAELLLFQRTLLKQPEPIPGNILHICCAAMLQVFFELYKQGHKVEDVCKMRLIQAGCMPKEKV